MPHVLVPGTPTPSPAAAPQPAETQDMADSCERSYGESYLHELMGGPPDGRLYATQFSEVPPSAGMTASTVGGDEKSADRANDGREPESPASPAAAASIAFSRDRDIVRSPSKTQPSMFVTGDLEDTQCQSLDRSALHLKHVRPRTSDASEIQDVSMGESEATAQGTAGETTAEGFAEGDGEVSMDLTQIAANDTIEDASGILDRSPVVTQHTGHNSQKENPQPTQATHSPAANLGSRQRLAPTNSHVQQTLDSTNGPSSSPAVAAGLLAGRLSPKKRAHEPASSPPPSELPPTQPESELSSSQDGAALDAHLRADTDSQRAAKASRSMPELSQDVGGPNTSTPVFAGARLPQPPLTAARTLPDFSRLDGPKASTSIITATGSGLRGQAVYQSSDVMKHVPLTKSPKKRDEWGDTSQDTTQDSLPTEPLSDAPRAPAQEEVDELDDDDVHMAETEPQSASNEFDGTKNMPIDDESYADTTADTTVDGPDRRNESNADASLQPSQQRGSQDTTFDSSLPILAPNAASGLSAATASASSEFDDGFSQHDRSPYKETLDSVPDMGDLGTQSQSQSSQSQSQAQSQSQSQSQSQRQQYKPSLPPTQTNSGSIPFPSSAASRINERIMNLTDIGDIDSSPAEQTQFSIEPTQLEYDVERLPPTGSTAPDPEPSPPGPIIDTLASDASRRQSIPRPGRELRRIPPPPSPVGASSLPPIVPVGAQNDDVSIDRESVYEPRSAALEETQQASSSPYVPLVTAAKVHSTRPTATASTSVADHGEKVSVQTSSAQPLSTSSNGVVPDSEGPTQSSPAPTPDQPTSSAAISPARAMNVDVQRDGSPVPTQLEKDGDAAPAAVETDFTAPSAGRSHVKLSTAPIEVTVDEPTKEPALQTPAAERSATTSKSKNKGKHRAPPTPDSPDELDLFQSSNRRPQQVEARPIEVDEDLVETNYDEPPHKHVSPKKGRPSGSSSGSSPAQTRKRRHSSVDVVVEVPVKRRARATPAAAVGPKAAKAKGKGKVKAAPVASAKRSAPNAKQASAGKQKRAAKARDTDEESHPETSDEDEQHVAGPSRVRFQSKEGSRAHSRRTSTAASEPDVSTASSAGLKIKLPASAPFSRIFALWRDDGWLYPATIVKVASGMAKVVFDDDSRATLKFSELRHSRLQRGDYIRYRGNEIDTETQAATLHGNMRVYRVERGEEGATVEGWLESTDTISATAEDVELEDQADEVRRGREQRLQVEAIAIGPEHVGQFDNRKLSTAEIAAFEARTPKPIKPLSLLDIPPAEDVGPLVVNKKVGLFSRCACLITGASDRSSLASLLQEYGGTIVDLEQLFQVRTDGGKGGESKLVFDRDEFQGIDTILCLADRPCTTAKYLVSLALGIPCVSSHFVYASVQEGVRHDWKNFTLTSGFLQSINTYAVGAQIRSVCKRSFNLESLATVHGEGGIFSGRSILVVPSKKGKAAHDEIRQVLTILIAAGATKVHFVANPEAASSATGYDNVILQDAQRKPSPLTSHNGVGSLTWLKQCLIAGRLLSPSMMKPTDE